MHILISIFFSCRKPVFSENETFYITKVLERLVEWFTGLFIPDFHTLIPLIYFFLIISLLPSARLTGNQMSSEQTVSEADAQNLKAEQLMKRNQLFIGINAASRGLTKKSVVSLLLADDIQPQFLYNHLLALCSQNHVPHIFMPGFRELTKKTLGFPCIVLGFKQDATFFSPVVNLIKSLFENGSALPESEANKAECNDSDAACSKTNKKEEIKEFTYVERASKSERAFIPDSVESRTELNKQGEDFIPLSSDTEINKNCVEEVEEELKKVEGETSAQKGKPKKVSQKKPNEKKYLMPCKYYKAEVAEVSSNPNRSEKKYKKLK